MSKSFHKQPQIIVDNGKIIRLNSLCIERDFDFSSTVKKAMIDLAKSDPLSFMELYLMLTDDEEFFKMASEIYEEYIDKNEFPYEIMKSLYNSDIPETTDTTQIVEFSSNTEFGKITIVIANGLVITIKKHYFGIIPCYRNRINFYQQLIDVFFGVANYNIKEFMKLYDIVKNDPVTFKIADTVRKEKLEIVNEQLNNTMNELKNIIDLLSGADIKFKGENLVSKYNDTKQKPNNILGCPDEELPEKLAKIQDEFQKASKKNAPRSGKCNRHNPKY